MQACVYADSPTHLIYLETLYRKSTDVHVLYWERLGKQASARRVAAVRHAGAAVDARAGSAPARAPGGHRKTVKAPSLIMFARVRRRRGLAANFYEKAEGTSG